MSPSPERPGPPARAPDPGGTTNRLLRAVLQLKTRALTAGHGELRGAHPTRRAVRRQRLGKENRRRTVNALLARYRDQGQLEARDEVVRLHLDLVRYLAGRFRGKGEMIEDLIQIGCVGLIKAIERFDPGRNVRFSTYVSHFILGEIKRHFRDKGWTLKVPRKLQELHVKLSPTRERLASRLGRHPTPGDLAEELGVSEEEVLEAEELGVAYQPLSLEAESFSENGKSSSSLLSFLGQADAEIDRLQDRMDLERALERLDPRERRVLFLRYWENCSQKRTGEVLGISQMQISRIQRQILDKLQRELQGAPALRRGPRHQASPRP